MDEKLSQIVRKVQKLLRLAKYGYKHEAEIALARAEELMRLHRVDVILEDDAVIVLDRKSGHFREQVTFAVAQALGGRSVVGQYGEVAVIGDAKDLKSAKDLYKTLIRAAVSSTKSMPDVSTRYVRKEQAGRYSLDLRGWDKIGSDLQAVADNTLKFYGLDPVQPKLDHTGYLAPEHVGTKKAHTEAWRIHSLTGFADGVVAAAKSAKKSVASSSDPKPPPPIALAKPPSPQLEAAKQEVRAAELELKQALVREGLSEAEAEAQAKKLCDDAYEHGRKASQSFSKILTFKDPTKREKVRKVTLALPEPRTFTPEEKRFLYLDLE